MIRGGEMLVQVSGVLTVLLFVVGLLEVSAEVPRHEVDSLRSLYECTAGGEWSWERASPVWNFTEDSSGEYVYNPCSSGGEVWQGLSCSSDPSVCSVDVCHITEVLLPSYNLQGFLPPELGNLSALEVLEIAANDLTSSIPTELGKLSALYWLDLSSNGLRGRIPEEIGDLTLLEMLDLEYNELTGSIPTTIGKLIALRWIDLQNLKLTGSIPRELGMLEELLGLELKSNKLSGEIPIELYKLPLEALLLSSNDLTGSIPDDIGNLTALFWLEVNSNMLTGTVSSEFGNLVELNYLDLKTNKLSGTIPPELGKLSVLEVLMLESNDLTDSIPLELGSLSSLKWLGLHSNHLTGTIASHLGNLHSLSVLLMHTNALTGSLPPEMGNLSSLGALDIENNLLTGKIPASLGKLLFLHFLDLELNELTGVIPSSLGQLSNLVRLGLDSNKLSGEIPPDFGNLFALETIELNSNLLTGSIPQELCQLSKLDWLGLHFNILSGIIPAQFGNLSALQTALLNHNALTGNFPHDIRSLAQLEALVLDVNDLSGPIPSDIGYLPALYFLDFDMNHLTGRIPIEFGNLSRLEVLSLDFNDLTGEIPAQLGSLSTLVSLDLMYNKLAGPIPSEIGDLSALFRLYLSSNDLSGAIPPQLGYLSSLEVLDLASNLLSGDIPSELGLLNAGSVSLSVNCLDVQIPNSLCNMKYVKVLSLNGLRGADGCSNTFKLPLFGTTINSESETKIPVCLWNIDGLNTLHVGGNGYVGEIDTDSVVNSTKLLSDISLSHNRLSGTIPIGIQEMRRVDISHNRFIGHLSDTVNTSDTTKFHAKVNRLSGRLPTQTLRDVPDLDILRGNLFSCDTIPGNDEFSHGYNCGSQLYDYSLYLMASSVLLLTIFMIYLYAENGAAYELFRNPLSIFDGDAITQRYPEINCICLILMKLQYHNKFFCCLVSTVIIGSIPVYLLRLTDTDHSYSSHWNSYSWAMSFSFMEGTLMSFLALLVWALGVTVYYVYVMYYLKKVCGGDDGSSSSVREESSKMSSAWSVKVVLAFVCNLCVTSLVNVLYILSITELSLSPAVSFIIRLSVSLFRVLNSAIIVPMLSSPVSNCVDRAVFMFRLLILNNTIIPCIVTALTSSNCFRELLVEPDAISTPFTYTRCATIIISDDDGSRTCREYETVTSESAPFVPGFNYNYQCSSALLEAYIPVLIIGFCLQLILPLCFLKTLNDTRFRAIPPFLRSNLCGIFCPDYWCHTGDTNNIDSNSLMKIPTIIVRDLVNPIAVILTFGLCSPALACIAGIVGVVKCGIWVWAMHNFSAFTIAFGNSGKGEARSRVLLSALSKMQFPLCEVLKKTFWLIFTCSMTFIVLIYWDTTGKIGWEAPCAVGTLALALSFMRFYAKGALSVQKSDTDKNVEVIAISVNPLGADNDP